MPDENNFNLIREDHEEIEINDEWGNFKLRKNTETTKINAENQGEITTLSRKSHTLYCGHISDDLSLIVQCRECGEYICRECAGKCIRHNFYYCPEHFRIDEGIILCQHCYRVKKAKEFTKKAARKIFKRSKKDDTEKQNPL